MEVTDPPDEETGESSRVTAVRTTWSRLLDESDYVKVGIVKFSANAKSETVELDDNQIPKTYFTRDTQRLEDGTAALEATERTTNFLVALDEAYSEMRTEMLQKWMTANWAEASSLSFSFRWTPGPGRWRLP